MSDMDTADGGVGHHAPPAVGLLPAAALLPTAALPVVSAPALQQGSRGRQPSLPRPADRREGGGETGEGGGARVRYIRAFSVTKHEVYIICL